MRGGDETGKPPRRRQGVLDNRRRLVLEICSNHPPPPSGITLTSIISTTERPLLRYVMEKTIQKV